MSKEEKEAIEFIKRLENLGLKDATISDMICEIEQLRDRQAHLSVPSLEGLEGLLTKAAKQLYLNARVLKRTPSLVEMALESEIIASEISIKCFKDDEEKPTNI